MLDLNIIEHDLLEMKAGTLAKYGKKVEVAEEMFLQKLELKKRLEKILARLKTEQVINKGCRKKKRQAELTDRIEGKLQRAEKMITRLEELKAKYIEEFKLQREACGLYDHTFLEEYYHEKEENRVNQE